MQILFPRSSEPDTSLPAFGDCRGVFDLERNLLCMSNHLKEEKSPYLLQHAENPVDWYPWCGEAFERAKDEDKPIFLSIGYSTCHWCHVMAHESFEDKKQQKF